MFYDLQYPSLEESYPVILEKSPPLFPAESALLPLNPLHFLDYISSLQDMYHLSNTVESLPCNYVIPPLKKDINTTFAWLNPKANSVEDFHCFDDCLFYS